MVGISLLLASLCLLSPLRCAYPDLTAREDSPKGGKKIVLPPRTNDTGLKQIPGGLLLAFNIETLTTELHNLDSAHPFRAPGPNDQRGPCRRSSFLSPSLFLNEI